MSLSKPLKVDPSLVEPYKKEKNPFDHIKTLKNICKLRDHDVPVPLSAEDRASTLFSYFSPKVTSILAQTIEEFERPDGCFSQSSHKKHSDVVQPLSDKEIKQLGVLRDCLRSHLCEHFHSLSRPPPNSGGDTARWSMAAQIYIIVCLLNCVLLRFGLGKAEYERFHPNKVGYLCGNLLVLDPRLISQYCVRYIQLTTHNALERLNAISYYDDSLDEFLRFLSYRTSELLCMSGLEADGVYNAPEWCAPIAAAHTGLLPEAKQMDKRLLTCTTDFVTHSMIWFVTLNAHVDNLYQLAPPPKKGLRAPPHEKRLSIEQTKQLRWYPTERMIFLVYEFFCKYAAGCKDDTYMHNIRDFCMQFEVSPDHPSIYRTLENTEMAIPADVIAKAMPNMSPVGKEFVRLIKYGMPMLEWWHRFWNWRKGETRIRSDYIGSNSFYTQLVLLYTIDLYFQNRLRLDTHKIEFRHRFVAYHK